MCWLRAKPGNSLLMERKNRSQQKRVGRRLRGRKGREGQERGEATQLELGGCQEASDDLQVHSAQVAAWWCGVNIQPWEAQALGLSG